VDVFRTRQVHVGLDREMVVQGDGEPMGPVTGSGVTVEVVPEALAVVRAE
jgi:diacylglycerol kinase family enzyme